MSVDLCACGHENSHVGKRCGKPVEMPDGATAICTCQSGIRVDLAAFQVLVEVNVAMTRIATTLTRILAVAEVASGLQSSIVGDGKGGFRIDVQQRPPVPQIIVPR